MASVVGEKLTRLIETPDRGLPGELSAPRRCRIRNAEPMQMAKISGAAAAPPGELLYIPAAHPPTTAA